MTSRPASNQTNRGFSLVELAIVLGVFGMIVSGLWGVVATVKEKIKRERVFEQTILVVRNVRSFFQSSASNQLSGVSGDFTNYTSGIAKKGLIPFEMIRDRTTTPLVLDHPWGAKPFAALTLSSGGFFLCDNAAAGNCDGVGTADTTHQTFLVRIKGIPFGACLYLAERLTGASGPPGLVKVYINSTAYDQTTNGYPIPLSWSKTKCVVDSTGNGNTLDFVFLLRQQTY